MWAGRPASLAVAQAEVDEREQLTGHRYSGDADSPSGGNVPVVVLELGPAVTTGDGFVGAPAHQHRALLICGPPRPQRASRLRWTRDSTRPAPAECIIRARPAAPRPRRLERKRAVKAGPEGHPQGQPRRLGRCRSHYGPGSPQGLPTCRRASGGPRTSGRTTFVGTPRSAILQPASMDAERRDKPRCGRRGVGGAGGSRRRPQIIDCWTPLR